MKKRNSQYLFTIFGIDVNLSSVLTTVIGGVSVFLINAAIQNGRANHQALRQVIQDVHDIKSEQSRIKREYAPELKK